MFPDISHDVDHARVARNMRALKYVTVKQANVSGGVCLPRAVSPGHDSVSEGKQHVRPFTSPSVPLFVCTEETLIENLFFNSQ